MGYLYTQVKPFRFDVSLRLVHPSMRSEEISRALNMQPRFQWNAGAPRVTPAGTPLRGVREETYWSSTLNDKSEDLKDTLDANLSALEVHTAFLQAFVETGGEIEYFVGWFTTDTSGGETLSWELLERLARLRISLALDVYGNK